MKDGEQVEVCRQELYDDYVNCYLQLRTDVLPCRDARLLQRATRYLLKEPEPRETFTVFPFYQTLTESCEALGTDCRKLLSAFIKAAELLETLCVNLFLQPWRKEIRTLKTFTGPFVYCLLPVLNNSTIQSVLASIGYLPHTDAPQSEYRLSEDANPDRAMLVGFELLLARVQCSHFLELLEKDQLGPQEWLEVVQRRVGPTKLEEPTEKKTTVGQKEEEEKKKEESVRKEVPLYLDSRLAVNPQPKPSHCHLISVDQSIMEMQMTYPDLAFRGRPLLPDKPHRANPSRSSSKSAHTASTNNHSDYNKAAKLPRRDCTEDTKAAAATTRSKNDGSKADDVLADDGKSTGCDDGNSGRSSAPADATSSSFNNTAGSRVDGDFSHPQNMSLHITLRAGSTAELKLKPGEPQPMVQPPARTQQQTAAELQDKRPVSPGLPSMSSTDEEKELRELGERMGQLHVHETKEELKSKEETKRGGEGRKKERRKKERKASREGEAEEQNLRRPVMEPDPALSHAASRSSQSDPAGTRQPTVCQPAPLTVSTADCQSCKGGNTEQQEGGDTERSRGEQEQLAQSYVMV